MKKFYLIIFSLICLFSCFGINVSIANAEDSTQTYVITANSANLYELPDLSSSKLKNLTHSTQVSILFQDGGAKSFNYDGFLFFKVVQFENTDGYVLADLVTPKNETLTAIPNFNAKTNAQCHVFFAEDTEKVESSIILEKNQKIFLYEGFKSKSDYTAIAFVYENQVMYGYLETKYVSPNGISTTLITCILLIMAVLGIVFAWVFMKSKKVRIRKRETKLKKNDTKN